MRKLLLLASVAAMAAAVPALAKGPGGQGKGGGGGNPHAAQGGGGGGGGGHAGHGGGGNPHVAQGSGQQGGHGGGQAQRPLREQRVVAAPQSHGNGHAQRQAQAQGGHGNSRGAAQRVERQPEMRRAERDDRRMEQVQGREARQIAERDWNDWASRRGGDRGFSDRNTYLSQGRPLPVRALGQGCPPGLARQNAFCLPPGQLRRAQLMGQRIEPSRYGEVPQEWQYRFRDNEDYYYRYDREGYVYRIGRENSLVSSIVPLFGSGLMVGEPMPLGYDVYNVPYAYRDNFVDNNDYSYRYDNNSIYRVNNGNNLIDSVVALLGGNGLNVGQPLPAGYDAYNLPYEYRDRYADNADSMYRYADGGIYQVDPTTQLVQALVEMIT